MSQSQVLDADHVNVTNSRTSGDDFVPLLLANSCGYFAPTITVIVSEYEIGFGEEKADPRQIN